MDYRILREARLRNPFRPFHLKTVSGRVFFVDRATHMAVCDLIVAVVDEKELPVWFKPEEVESISYYDEPSPNAV